MITFATFRDRRGVRALALVSALAWSATTMAQAPPGTAQAQPGARGAIPELSITAGLSTVLLTPFDITRIAVTNPAIADAVVVKPREVLVDGKAAGTVTLMIWGGDERLQYDVVVDAGVTTLQQTLRQLFPGEDIRVAIDGEAIILSGRVSTHDAMMRAGEVAAGTSSKHRIINMLQLPGGHGSQQVMLQVRVAEVNRRALQELGANLFMFRQNWAGRSTTQQFPAPDFDEQRGGLVFSDFLNIFVFYRKEGPGAVIRALEQKGYFQSLAEPNLIAYNGQEASFLAGGEFPVPIVQGVTGAVTIEFKEFGVRLSFRPTIAGEVIRLRVRPEVSSLDFNNGLVLEGFRIPALITRRAETDVELRDGQSFAIAGLLNNNAQEVGSGIPILSKLPIIGYLFRSRAKNAEQTELMVLVTPRLVQPLDPDHVPPLPVDPGLFLPPRGGRGATDAPPVPLPRGSQ
jgi:pilus assembly protein CpaC